MIYATAIKVSHTRIARMALQRSLSGDYSTVPSELVERIPSLALHALVGLFPQRFLQMLRFA